MRSHGIPGWPDPVVNAHGLVFNGTGGVTPGSPLMQSAQQACRSLLPAQRWIVSSAGDGFNLGEMKSLGIGISSPQFKSAQHACFTGSGGLGAALALLTLNSHAIPAAS